MKQNWQKRKLQNENLLSHSYFFPKMNCIAFPRKRC